MTTQRMLVLRRKDDVKTKIPVWVRVPKIWDEFLETKAMQEYCTKSDLLRQAVRLAYGSEMKEFRVQPEVNGTITPTGFSTPTERDFFNHSNWEISQDIKRDPWIESAIAFVENKKSINTNHVYRLALSQLFIFAAKHPGEVKQSDVISYRHKLEQLGRSPSTIRQHLAAISGYYNFCISWDLTLYNPAKGVNRPVVQDYVGASWLTRTQAKMLLEQPNRNSVKGKRDYAILLTLLLTGLRRSELANIRKGDIGERGDKLYLTYVRKGGTKTVQNIPRKCWEAIQDYLFASKREMHDSSPIFVPVTKAGIYLKQYYGRNGNDERAITTEAIRQIVTCYSRQALGPEVKVTPHTLRHTAGTLLRKSGRSIEEVQSFLKHKRIDTTRRYLHVVECDDSEFGEDIAKSLEL